jgi:hypothetical protein
MAARKIKQKINASKPEEKATIATIMPAWVTGSILIFED